MEGEEALAGAGWLAAVPDSLPGCGCSTETAHVALQSLVAAPAFADAVELVDGLLGPWQPGAAGLRVAGPSVAVAGASGEED